MFNLKRDIGKLEIQMSANSMAMEGILDKAKSLDRDLTSDEQKKFDSLMHKVFEVDVSHEPTFAKYRNVLFDCLKIKT